MQDHRAGTGGPLQSDPEQRTAVVLHELGGLNAREIADDLDMPLPTVKSHLRRGGQALVSLLAKTAE